MHVFKNVGEKFNNFEITCNWNEINSTAEAFVGNTKTSYTRKE